MNGAFMDTLKRQATPACVVIGYWVRKPGTACPPRITSRSRPLLNDSQHVSGRSRQWWHAPGVLPFPRRPGLSSAHTGSVAHHEAASTVSSRIWLSRSRLVQLTFARALEDAGGLGQQVASAVCEIAAGHSVITD
jgi:hypothetical protein